MHFRCVLCVLLFAAVVVTARERLKGSPVKLIDTHYPKDPGEMKNDWCQNYLFRTGILLNRKGVFAYNELHGYLADAATRWNILLPSEYFLVIYDLMWSGMEKEELKAERAFFNSNPDLGIVIHHAIVGTTKKPPSHYNESTIEKYTANWDNYFRDKYFDEFIDSIHLRLIEPCHSRPGSAPLPKVILFHCSAGRDRTGEVAGSYLMKYGRQSFPQVSASDYEISNQPIIYRNQRLMVWYCQYLVHQLNYSESLLQCSKEENMYKKKPSKPLMLGWDIDHRESTWTLEEVVAVCVLELIGILFLYFSIRYFIRLRRRKQEEAKNPSYKKDDKRGAGFKTVPQDPKEIELQVISNDAFDNHR